MEPLSDKTLAEWREAEAWAAEFRRRLLTDPPDHLLEWWRITVPNGVGMTARTPSTHPRRG